MIIIHRRRPATVVARPVPTQANSEESINPVYAALLRVFGPPESPDNPLLGTKYDPRLAAQRQREEGERRRARSIARWQRWDTRLHGHNPVPPWTQAGEAAASAEPTRPGGDPADL